MTKYLELGEKDRKPTDLPLYSLPLRVKPTSKSYRSATPNLPSAESQKKLFLAKILESTAGVSLFSAFNPLLDTTTSLDTMVVDGFTEPERHTPAGHQSSNRMERRRSPLSTCHR
jgi:hypothetical protein